MFLPIILAALLCPSHYMCSIYVSVNRGSACRKCSYVTVNSEVLNPCNFEGLTIGSVYTYVVYL